MAPITLANFALGGMTFVFTTLSAVLGFLMITKYLKHKEKLLIYVGLTWFFISTVWWGDSLTFLFMLVGGEENVLPDQIYFFIDNAFILPIFFLWPLAFGELVLSGKPTFKKALFIILSIWGCVFEILFLTQYFIDYSALGIRSGPYTVQWGFLVMFYIFLGSLIFIITGLIFANKAVKSEDPTIKFKGRLLLVAFLLLITGVVLEIFFVEFFVLNFLARTIYSVAAAFFYNGFMLPKFIQKRLFKPHLTA